MRKDTQSKSADIISRLETEGWQRVGGKGVHVKFKHTGKPGHVVVPYPRKNIPAGTLRNIYRQAGWLVEVMKMLYPVYVHKDQDSAYGLTFPDFPGCFSAADELAELPRSAQEAVEVHFEGENFPIPQPSSPEQWANDERFQGGYWMLLDIDLSRLSTKATRLNISLPEYLVQRIDAYAAAHHQSRSDFLAQAAEEAMRGGR